mgnify:CR=1 FL=1
MGVWIETSIATLPLLILPVTPCMGVWIETWRATVQPVPPLSHTLYGCVDWNRIWIILLWCYSESHPVWVCGLKQPILNKRKKGSASHPVWVCGLKLNLSISHFLINKSHPVWVCGLKLHSVTIERPESSVTPCMGVWIETTSEALVLPRSWSHTLYGCVDWNSIWLIWLMRTSSHTLYGCVDWNIWTSKIIVQAICHTLYGCVDWNCALDNLAVVDSASHPVWVCGLKLDDAESFGMKKDVTPCMGVWIETRCRCRCWYCPLVTPCMGVWIETVCRAACEPLPWVTPCMGVWIETLQTPAPPYCALCHTLYGCVDWNTRRT